MERFTEFDFGITGLASLFHQDWGHIGSPDQVVLAYLDAGEDPSPHPSLVEQAATLSSDIELLEASAMSDVQLELLWVAATGGNYRFRPPESGRSLLRTLGMASLLWRQRYGVATVRCCVDYNDLSIGPRISELVDSIQLRDLESRGRPDRLLGEVELRAALHACAGSASPELAFRFLLRIHAANFLPIRSTSWEKYSRLAAELSYGEHLLSGLEFLVEE